MSMPCTAVLLLASDLTATGYGIEVERSDPTYGFAHLGVFAYRRRDPELFRIDPSACSCWQPDTSGMPGLRDMAGIHNPPNLATHVSYRWSVAARGDKPYNLLGARYVLADKGTVPGDQRLTPVYTDGPSDDVCAKTTRPRWTTLCIE